MCIRDRYPIIRWEGDEQSVPGVIDRLEQWMIAALQVIGIEGVHDERMQGVWVNERKICSIGLSFLKWVSRHGLAINIDTESGRVEALDGCGLESGLTTSLHSLGYTHDLEGRLIDRNRLEEALLQTATAALGRAPLPPLDFEI